MSATQPSTAPLVVSIPQAAKMLSLSPATVRELVRTGEIPSKRIGARLMISTEFLRKLGSA